MKDMLYGKCHLNYAIGALDTGMAAALDKGMAAALRTYKL